MGKTNNYSVLMFRYYDNDKLEEDFYCLKNSELEAVELILMASFDSESKEAGQERLNRMLNKINMFIEASKSNHSYITEPHIYIIQNTPFMKIDNVREYFINYMIENDIIIKDLKKDSLMLLLNS